MPRVINSDKLENKLFDSVDKDCTAVAGYCKFKDSIIVWSPRIIHECELEYVDKANFKVVLNNKSIYSENPRYFFKLVKKESICNISVFQTREGLYVAELNETKKLKLDLAHNNAELIPELLLADNDYTSYRLWAYIHNLEERMCTAFLSSIFMRKSHSPFLIFMLMS